MTRPLHSSSQHLRRSAQAGFSLVELLMQLIVLTVVILPMTMMMNVQRDDMLQNQRNTSDRIFADQLFDNIDIHMPDPVDTYTVNTYTSGGSSYFYSVYCDPSTRLKDGISSSSVTSYQSTCSSATTGDQLKGPYFQRTVAYLPNYQGLRVTVSLFKNRLSTTTAYFQVSREYQLDSYRVQVGSNVYTDRFPKSLESSETYTIDTSPGYTTSSVDQNNDGQIWYPDTGITSYINPDSTNDAYRYITSCTSAAVSATDVPNVPYQRYRDIAGGCGGITYRFKVMPGRTYDVNLYYQLPHALIGMGCEAGTTNTSCAIAKSIIEMVTTTSGSTVTGTPAVSGRLDLNLATGLELNSASTPLATKGLVSHTSIAAPSDAAELLVNVDSISGGHAYLSGIEVFRRDDQ